MCPAHFGLSLCLIGLLAAHAKLHVTLLNGGEVSMLVFPRWPPALPDTKGARLGTQNNFTTDQIQDLVFKVAHSSVC